MTAPISRFPVPSLEAMPADVRERILAVQAKAGFVPNVHRTVRNRKFPLDLRTVSTLCMSP